MASEAYSIKLGIADKIDTNKNIIKSVSRKFQLYDNMEQEAIAFPERFPRAYVYIGLLESQYQDQSGRSSGQPIAPAKRMTLPIGVTLYVPGTDAEVDIEESREDAIKEIRDLVEDPASAFVTAKQYRIWTQDLTVERLIDYTPEDNRILVFGIADISFRVLYDYALGNC